MHEQVRDIVRMPLSLLTRLRLILFGHEDLAGIVFWAALVGLLAHAPIPRLRLMVACGGAAGIQDRMTYPK